MRNVIKSIWVLSIFLLTFTGCNSNSPSLLSADDRILVSKVPKTTNLETSQTITYPKSHLNDPKIYSIFEIKSKSQTLEVLTKGKSHVVISKFGFKSNAQALQALENVKKNKGSIKNYFIDNDQIIHVSGDEKLLSY